MRKTLSLFFFLLFISAAAQTPEKISAVLAKKDFSAFTGYRDSLNGGKNSVRINGEFQREVVQGYEEGIYYFEKSVPDKLNKAVSTVYTWRVRLITAGNTIIYYQLTEKKNKKSEAGWEPWYDEIVSYKNDSLYLAFNNAFFAVFKTRISDPELFHDDIVYGDHCGYAGTSPQEKMQVDSWVMKKDIASLHGWLQSPDTEKQMYAVEGFYSLKKEGINPTPEERKMINAILSKKGYIHTCSGCIYGNREISEIARNFKF